VNEVQYFCPRCQGLEIEIAAQAILTGQLGDRQARCHLCGWTGTVEDLIGALSPTGEVFWTSDRVASALLKGVTKFAAGPCVQLMEVIGLVPKIEGSVAEQQSARDVREAVLKAVLAAVVTAAFEAAAEPTLAHYRRFRPELVVPASTAFEGVEPIDA
jgi:hypothetical protein